MGNLHHHIYVTSFNDDLSKHAQFHIIYISVIHIVYICYTYLYVVSIYITYMCNGNGNVLLYNGVWACAFTPALTTCFQIAPLWWEHFLQPYLRNYPLDCFVQTCSILWYAILCIVYCLLCAYSHLYLCICLHEFTVMIWRRTAVDSVLNGVAAVLRRALAV